MKVSNTKPCFFLPELFGKGGEKRVLNCFYSNFVALWFRICDLACEFLVATRPGLLLKFFKPLLQGRAIAEARLQRKGRNIVFADARLASDAGEVLAAGSCIYMPLPL